MKDITLEEINKQVRKSNILIQKAKFRLTAQQQKIVLHLIAQIHPWDDDFKVYEFNVMDFAKICGLTLKGGKDYTEIKEQIRKIADKSSWITLEDGNRETLVRWIEEPIINTNSGTVQLRLNRHLKPYLLQLREKFTEYDLRYTLRMHSKYSIRLYELVCSIHYHDLYPYMRSFTLEELRERLDCECYTDYRDFRKRVLDKAIKEINTYSDKVISYDPIKKGKKVVAIELTIRSKDYEIRQQTDAKIEKELGIVDP